jgi:amylosucrase
MLLISLIPYPTDGLAMPDTWFTQQAALSLARIRPRIAAVLPETPENAPFYARLDALFETVFFHLHTLYHQHYDFFYHLEAAVMAAAQNFAARPASLRALDQARSQDPNWFQSEKMLGAVCYVDRYAGTLNGLRERIPYFQQLGITYLHLMPLFASPALNNDGGYAVSSFREVNPALGTTDDLRALTETFRTHGISLVLDFVFNHTSDEHVWAQRALAGDPQYQAYYRMFDDRTLPDQYERHLREIFPDQAPGSFTYRPDLGKWVWTTFYPFQWDLNYANPALFVAMLEEMMFLANCGVEILRLDAVPFVWKELGTPCENLPQTHTLIRAYNALMRIANPALIFKSEAIVHPRDVRSYIAREECPISYNPILMVSLWESLATRDAFFMRHTMQKQFALGPGTAWINYVRSHDDIGWGFADEDAAEVGIDGAGHRRFLNQFFTGQFEGSFARGLPFNYNPKNGDMRINGTTASLAGLEQALATGDPAAIELAARRILLVYGIVFAAGGIPLIYLGDELGTLNDRSYEHDPGKAEDSRWIHRPPYDPARAARAETPGTIEHRIFSAMLRMIAVRKAEPRLADGETRFLETYNRHVFAFTRHEQVWVLGNFSEHAQTVELARIGLPAAVIAHAHDLISAETRRDAAQFVLEPHALVWLVSGAAR